MNEELQNALAEILNKTVSGMSAAGDFLQAEIPEVIAQLLLWKAITSLLSALFVASLAAGIFWAARRSWLYLSANKASFDGFVGPPLGMAYAGVLMLVAFGAFVLSEASLDWLQIWLAPKVYLIEYAASLAK